MGFNKMPRCQDLRAEELKYYQNDTASMEAALKGIFGAFVVTDFYLRKQKERESC